MQLASCKANTWRHKFFCIILLKVDRIQNPRTLLVKINDMCFYYLATTSLLSAVLTITPPRAPQIATLPPSTLQFMRSEHVAPEVATDVNV